MWHYNENLRALHETPELEVTSIDQAAVDAILGAARREGRTLLTEYESKRLLAAYAIPVARTEFAENEDKAVEAAADLFSVSTRTVQRARHEMNERRLPSPEPSHDD